VAQAAKSCQYFLYFYCKFFFVVVNLLEGTHLRGTLRYSLKEALKGKDPSPQICWHELLEDERGVDL